MLRAEDRLSEAEFFLEKVRETQGKGETFRYYFSALVTATRSITLVLQKDLRAAHGIKFDTWWEARRTAIPAEPISFDVIRNLRNTLEKEGSKLPLEVYGGELAEGPIEAIEFRSEPATAPERQRVVRITLKVRRGGLPTVSVQGRSRKEVDDKMRKVIAEQAVTLVEETADRLSEFDLRLLGFALAREASPLSFNEVVEGFAGYLREIRTVIQGAKAEFAVKN